jgi:hypothetical protein
MTNAEEQERAWATAPDSAWAAEWARVALEHGRIELGYHLSKLAVHAHRYEQANPKPNPPIVPGAEAAPVFDGLRQHLNAAAAAGVDEVADHPTGLLHAAGDLCDTATALAPVVMPNGRCKFGPPGALECHRVVFFDPAVGHWTHMDPEVDDLHAPVPPIVLPAANGAAAQ